MGIVLIEPAFVPDVYICGLIRPEDLGNGDWRYTGYTRQETFDGSGPQCVVNSRLIVPTHVIMQSVRDTMKALGMACCGAERMKARH